MMNLLSTRRHFLKASAALTGTGSLLLPQTGLTRDPQTVRVVVWDEQQPAQKAAYENFLGNWIARYLETRPGLVVKSVRLDDPEQGLATETLEACDVLIWWGHVRHRDIRPETGRKIVDRILSGRLGLIALHSAHWSTPFVEAMYERTRRDTERRFSASGAEKVEITYSDPVQRYTVPKAEARMTPYAEIQKFPEGITKARIHYPYCCFPSYRADGKPSTLRVLKPDHPIVAGIPREFTLPHTEMYNEPFHVPEPDVVLLEERWSTGEWFRSGSLWELGKGKVFYFRPGHETFAVFKERPVLQILENAARWMALRKA